MHTHQRRSTRKLRAVDYTQGIVPSYPDERPANELEKAISRLDQQSFPWGSFAKVDDAIVYILFGTKRHDKNYRAWHPEPSVPSVAIPITREQAILARHIYDRWAPQTEPDRPKAIDKVIEQWKNSISGMLCGDEVLIAKHLLSRYELIYAEGSHIRLEKVTFDGRTPSGGLKANKKLLAGSPLLETASSMSSDIVPSENQGVSVIISHKDQKGPVGARLMLGPIRFANHDCRPNCQLKPIKASNAFIVYTLQDIEQGESLTVQYTRDASYFPDGCKCASCNPDNPPVLQKRLAQVVQNDNDGEPKKRTRRGGRRARNKPSRVQKRENAATNTQESCS